jgi:hypothetical protein
VSVTHTDFGDLGLARNHGARVATGEFLCFLDGDDLMSSNWLVDAYDVARRHERAIVHPRFNIIFGCGEDHIYEHIPSTHADFDKRRLVFANYWLSPSFSRRTTYLEVPYSKNELEGGFGFEDWKWNCDTIHAGYQHLVAENSIHLIRRRQSSLRLRSLAARCLMTPSPRFFDPPMNDPATASARLP